MTLTQTAKHHEMDGKRWLVRYAILGAIGTILAVKLYLLLFVIDTIVGIYSFITSFVLFSVLLFAYTKYKDPYYDIKNNATTKEPLVSIIIPVKNEENNIRNCINSCINSTYGRKEVIVINDGSNDKTSEILDELRRENNIKVLHMSKSVGKKKAVQAGTEIARGDIFVFMDSDCNMASDAVENAVRIFQSDNKIGAVTAHGRVRDAKNGNALKKIQDVWYDGQYRIIKGMESSFSSITCCSGALTAFRRAAVQPYIEAWANDKFLGSEFKFATDRRLTAYVLGAKPPTKTSDNLQLSITQVGQDDVDTMKASGSDEFDQKGGSSMWKIKYSQFVRVFIGPPEDMKSLLLQQVRWRKSFIRSIFATGAIYYKRPFMAAVLYYLQLGLKIIRPYIVLQSLIFLPLMGDYLTAIFYVSSTIFTGMIYGIDFRLRNPGNSNWLYRPLLTLMSTFIFTWLLVYAAITIKKTKWR